MPTKVNKDVLRLVNWVFASHTQSQFIAGVELAANLAQAPYVNSTFEDLRAELVDLPELLQTLVAEGFLLEVEYTQKIAPDRVKSLYALSSRITLLSATGFTPSELDAETTELEKTVDADKDFTHEARRYCHGDSAWSSWQPCTEATAAARQTQSDFQVRRRVNATQVQRVHTR